MWCFSECFDWFGLCFTSYSTIFHLYDSGQRNDKVKSREENARSSVGCCNIFTRSVLVVYAWITLYGETAISHSYQGHHVQSWGTWIVLGCLGSEKFTEFCSALQAPDLWKVCWFCFVDEEFAVIVEFLACVVLNDQSLIFLWFLMS